MGKELKTRRVVAVRVTHVKWGQGQSVEDKRVTRVESWSNEIKIGRKRTLELKPNPS